MIKSKYIEQYQIGDDLYQIDEELWLYESGECWGSATSLDRARMKIIERARDKVLKAIKDSDTTIAYLDRIRIDLNHKIVPLRNVLIPYLVGQFADDEESKPASVPPLVSVTLIPGAEIIIEYMSTRFHIYAAPEDQPQAVRLFAYPEEAPMEMRMGATMDVRSGWSPLGVIEVISKEDS